jgi:DNA-directed RNA polymerase
LVNNISSVSYKINREVLDFILSNNDEYNFITDPKYVHPLSLKNKLTKKDKTKLESFNSTRSLEQNIIGLALAYSNVPYFYIPIRLDSRGRLYCQPQYLNYQSTELAKSLLLFAKPDKIYKTDKDAINYLKIYGANCFGHSLSKASFKERIQ